MLLGANVLLCALTLCEALSCFCVYVCVCVCVCFFFSSSLPPLHNKTQFAILLSHTCSWKNKNFRRKMNKSCQWESFCGWRHAGRFWATTYEGLIRFITTWFENQSFVSMIPNSFIFSQQSHSLPHLKSLNTEHFYMISDRAVSDGLAVIPGNVTDPVLRSSPARRTETRQCAKSCDAKKKRAACGVTAVTGLPI